MLKSCKIEFHFQDFWDVSGRKIFRKINFEPNSLLDEMILDGN